jgi:hypothetical protein
VERENGHEMVLERGQESVSVEFRWEYNQWSSAQSSPRALRSAARSGSAIQCHQTDEGLNCDPPLGLEDGADPRGREVPHVEITLKWKYNR